MFILSFKLRNDAVLLPGKSHGRRSLVGYSPWGRKELDTTEQLPYTATLMMLYLHTMVSSTQQCACLIVGDLSNFMDFKTQMIWKSSDMVKNSKFS